MQKEAGTHRISFWLLAVWCTVSANTSVAANIDFTIKQKGTGDPVAGATVASSDGVYAESDPEGQVVLDLELPAQLKVLAPGYETLLTQVTASSTTTLYLTPQSYSMEGLEVVEERIPEKVSKVTLSADELQHAPGSGGDPIKVIQSLPGVVTAADGTGVMYMRGSDANDNIVRVNGLPIPYLYHWGGLQSTVNPALVKDFNVFLGGFPVEYGDHLGGAIDIKLRAPKNDRIHQRYQIGTYESSFLIEGPALESGNDSFYIAARRSYIDFLLSPDQFNDFQDNDDDEGPSNEIITVPRFYDVQALWRHDLQRGSIDFQYFAAGDELALLNRESELTDPDLAGELNMEIGYQSAGINWREQLSSQWSHETVFALSQSSQRFSLGSDADGNPYYANTKPWSAELQPELHWQQGDAGRYTFGTELAYLNYPLQLYIAEPPAPGEVDYDYSTAPKHRVDRTVHASLVAPFVKYRQTWGDLTGTAGLRYSTFGGSGGIGDNALSPRMSLEYALTPDTLLTAAWGRYVQIPSAGYILEELGNPELTYTEAEHRVLGIKQQLSPNWSVQLEGYHKPMTELVVGTDTVPPDNYVNEGSGEAYGADLLIKRDNAQGKSGWLSYSYAKSRRTNDLTGERYDFQGDQPHTLTLVWSQPMTGSWNRWRWGVRAQVASGRPFTPVVDRTEETLPDGRTRIRPIYGEPYSERLPTYYRVDMRFDRRVLFNDWTLNFYIDLQNVTFHKNVTGYDYGSEYQNIDNPEEVGGVPFMPFFGIETIF